MSPIKAILLWFSRPLVGACGQSSDLDAMSLRDWADLPIHHPCADAACAVLKP